MYQSSYRSSRRGLFGAMLAMFGGGALAFLLAVVIVIALNLGLLAAAVWVVVSVLQAMGVL